jgi:flagellar biosynthesis/type III secretory pathway M-ring protein FliF/YscJ
MEYLVILLILSAVVVFVSAPIRRAASSEPAAEPAPAAPEVADLEAAREAKYRELRDAELDFRTGKLSDNDYEELDRTLRGEAITILRGLDREHEREEDTE